MEFVVLKEKEFSQFAKTHPQESYFQTVEIGKLRESYGSEIHYVGLKDKNKIVAATLMTKRKNILGRYTFYAPRGFLIDYHNRELLTEFVEKIRKYCKDKKGNYIKIDPNVIYRKRAASGDIIEENGQDDETVNNLKELGFKHFGFTTELGNNQSRWNFLVTLDVPYDELKERFSKSTRKNIEACYKKGIRVRKATYDDLEEMEDILIKTADRKGFEARDIEYYRRMYKLLGDNVRIYLAHLDPKIYLESAKDNLNESIEKRKEIDEKMSKDMIGNKLKTQKETIDKLVEKNKEEVQEAEKFKKEFPNGKAIGVLISLKSGQEYLTLYSGYLTEYKRFTPKYAMYNEHILDAYKDKTPFVNFYGITGNFNPDDKNYGMYEFKRGFSGNVVELVGEFSLPLDFTYHIYNFLSTIKRKMR